MKHRLSVLSLLLVCAGCADDSFAVVSVLTRSGSLDGVDRLRLYVKSGASEDVLLYPRQPASPLRLDTDTAVTLSVEFRGWSGQAAFEVEALGADSTVLAYGKALASVSHRAVVTVPVKVMPGTVRPEHPLSGALSCAPSAPADTCGVNRTCGVLCSPSSAAESLCYAAGTRAPGESCASNNDCGPGAQCFTFTAVGCSVMTCLRFCEDDSSCGDPNANCNVPIRCGDGSAYKVCSRPCDPTVATNTGCAPGLACSVYAGDRTDCACPGLGAVGSACTQNAGCRGEPGCSGCSAGLSCVIPTGSDAGTGTGTCRPVCNLTNRTCPAGTTCHAFDSSSGNTYGFCQ